MDSDSEVLSVNSLLEVSDDTGSDEEPKREGSGKTIDDAKAWVARSVISDEDEGDSVDSSRFHRPGDLATPLIGVGGTEWRRTEDWNH